MPAYRERIYLCPAENGQPGWVMEFPAWWDRSDFFKKFGGRQFDTGNPVYVDHALLITVNEAMAWDERSRRSFMEDPHVQQAGILDAMQQFESKLKSIRWVIVESYEWESGFE